MSAEWVSHCAGCGPCWTTEHYRAPHRPSLGRTDWSCSLAFYLLVIWTLQKLPGHFIIIIISTLAAATDYKQTKYYKLFARIVYTSGWCSKHELFSCRCGLCDTNISLLYCWLLLLGEARRDETLWKARETPSWQGSAQSKQPSQLELSLGNNHHSDLQTILYITKILYITANSLSTSTLMLCSPLC